MPPRSYSIFALIVAGLVLALTYWIQISTRLISMRGDPLPEGAPDMVGENVTAAMYFTGDEQASNLKAKSFVHFSDGAGQFVEPVLNYFARQYHLILTSPYAEIMNDGKSVQLSRGVQVTWKRPDGDMVLNTEKLEANLADGIVRTDTEVIIKQGKNEVQASGFVYEKSQDVLKMQGRVKGVFFLAQKRPT